MSGLGKAYLKATFFSSITNPSTTICKQPRIYRRGDHRSAFAVVNGSLSVGQLSSFLSYANQYTKPFNEISGVVTEFQNAVACAQRIFDSDRGRTSDAGTGERRGAERYTVEMSGRSMWTSPTWKGRKLIRDFNLDVKARTADRHRRAHRMRQDDDHQSAHAVLRCEGMDRFPCRRNTDIREMTRKSLRAGYGMVLQDTWLKDGNDPG